MKKHIVFTLIVLAWIFALTSASAAVSESKKDVELDAITVPTFQLPASLTIIEDEAFEGTAITNIDLPELLEYIGDNAFANIPTLRFVSIPDNTKYIAGTAFTGSRHVKISGAPNSYARAWARENGIPFAPVAVLNAGTGTVQITASQDNQQEQNAADVNGFAAWTQKCPQWRSASEIKAAQYDACIANHISGRAPPALA